MIRAFIAIPLPETAMDDLERLQQALPAGRPMRRGTLHLTLVFLGELPEQLLEEIHEAIGSVTVPRFELMFEGVATFGRAHARSLHAGVADSPELRLLQGKLTTAARRAGADVRARKFVPHVTLARFANGADPAMLGRFLTDHAGFRSAAFGVDGFCLYRSDLTPAGAVHQELARYPLG